MKLNYIKSGNSSWGGALAKPLRYLDRIISDRFRAEDIIFPYESIEITLTFPPDLSKQKEVHIRKYIDWYDKLPYYYRGRKMLIIHLPFSEKNENLIDVFQLTYTAFDIIAAKKKKTDNLDTEKIKSTLQQLEKELQTEDLWELHNKYEHLSWLEIIKHNWESRLMREQSNEDKKRLIYDIRFMPYFKGVDLKFLMPYRNQFCDIILDKLRNRKFRLPGYTHLYISCSDTFDNALYHTGRIEKWYVYGIAVFEDYANYESKTEPEKRRIVFDLTKQGLTDIATVDRLDIKTLNEVLDEVEQEYFSDKTK